MINQPFLQLPLRILLTVFATFTILRAGLLISNWDQFSSLTVEQIIWAFVYGLRFDASTIAVTLGLPMLLLFVPQRFFSRKKWISLFLIVIYVLYISLILTVVSDSVYFSYLQRHIGSEITLALDDPELLKDMILGDYAWAVVLFLALSLLGAKLWYRAFSKVEFHAPDGKQFLVVLIVSIALIVVSARGGFQYKPVKMADAFAASDSTNEAYLMINGAFAFQHSLRAPKASLKKFMTDSEALSLLHRTLSSEADEFVDGNSMVRQIKTPSTTEKKPNVVLLLLESVDAEHFDAIRTQQGKEPLGLTPNLDHLAKEGLLFTNFYANGRRSIEGLAAILASVPSLPTLPFLGKGLEQNRLSFIGDLAYHQGYNTVFLQSSKRNSFHIDAIAKNSGFRTYLGAEDVTKPAEFSFPTQSDWGVWDHYTFDTAADTFKARQPFFGMIFTSTTHNPFRVPDKQWEKFSDD
ncbi:MAG: sulfatase-like hydrolase/transferase, partial [Gammaproteobacteria bacterium]|nr:sulfatase-like hydrolase/transferase [Gammaproteobacteria bacterium]